MLDAVWGMVGGDEGIESGVPNPSKDLPVWSSNAPLPKKEEKCIGNTKEDDQNGYSEQTNMLSFKVFNISI